MAACCGAVGGAAALEAGGGAAVLEAGGGAAALGAGGGDCDGGDGDGDGGGGVEGAVTAATEGFDSVAFGASSTFGAALGGTGPPSKV